MTTPNNFTYSVWPSSKAAERTAAGFVGGNYSTDGTLIIGDKGDALDSGDTGAVKPSYVTAEEFPNWPLLSHAEALDLVKREATTEGGSDGWRWVEPDPV